MIRTLVIACLILLIGCGNMVIVPSNEEVHTILYHDGKVVLCMPDGHRVQLAGIKVTTFDPEAPTEQRAAAIEHRCITKYELQTLLRNRLRLKYVTETAENSLQQVYVYIDDISINAELIRRGYAYAVSIAPSSNSKYNAMFESLEEEARRTRSGLWAYKNAGTILPSTVVFPASVVKEQH